MAGPRRVRLRRAVQAAVILGDPAPRGPVEKSFDEVELASNPAVMDEVASSGQESISYKPQPRPPRDFSASEARRAAKIGAARTKVLALIATGEVTRRSQLEDMIGKAQVAFMRCWDREWFDRTLPSKGPEGQSRISDLAAFDTDLAATLERLKHEASQRGEKRRLSVHLACRTAGFRLNYYFAIGALPKSLALIRGDSEIALTPTPDSVEESEEAAEPSVLAAGSLAHFAAFTPRRRSTRPSERRRGRSNSGPDTPRSA